MRYTIFISLVIQALLLSLWGCTESATQWEHQRQSEEKQRELDNESFDLAWDAKELTKRVQELEKRVETLETK